MKSFYRESAYNVPIRIIRVFLFVIALMSFLPKSVSAQSSITYTLQTSVYDCPGCDLTDADQALYLSGPVPVALKSIDSGTMGAVDMYCGSVNTGTVTSNEYAGAAAYVYFDTMGLSLSVTATASPQYILKGDYQPCYQTYNPARPRGNSHAELGFQNVFHATFPGLPDGTLVTYRFTKVWDVALDASNYDTGGASMYLEFWDPATTTPYELSLHAPSVSQVYLNKVIVQLKTGVSYTVSNYVWADVNAKAGWILNIDTPVEWVPRVTSSITAMSTFAYYIDVLTPGASYYTDSGTIYPTSDSVHLDISLAGTGSGSVKSSPPGIDCGSTCSVHYLPGSTVTLTAIPAAGGSIFLGWSTDPACTDGSVFMTTTKSCTVTFDLCPGTTRTQIGSTNYDSISLAYGGAATNGDTIKILASNQQEGPINFGSDKSVALTGGYDCLFSNVVSYTVVTGSITISAGDVTIGNIVIL